MKFDYSRYDRASIVLGAAITDIYLISRGVRDFASISQLPRDKKILKQIREYAKINGFEDIIIELKEWYCSGVGLQSEIFICNKESEWKIKKFMDLVKSGNYTSDYHKQMGALFSYSKEAIENFINRGNNEENS